MGNITTKEGNYIEPEKVSNGWWYNEKHYTEPQEESKGWWQEFVDNARKHKDDSPYTKKLWAAWEKQCKYMNEVRANWKIETELHPRLRRLAEEDLHELGGVIEFGMSLNEDCEQEYLDKFPALELYFLVKRDMKIRLANQSSSLPPSPREDIEQREMGALKMLPELEAWLYRPGDSITDFKTRIGLWAETLDICEREIRFACPCRLSEIRKGLYN